MNLIRKILKQALVWLFVASFAFPAQFASAFVEYPSPTEAMDQIMTDLRMDKGEVEKTIDDMNVSRLKKSPPTVTLKFVPESPVDNKELTALAVPAYFTGNPEQMYYTWYLKHDNGEPRGEDELGRMTRNGNTDWNDNGEFDIEDYKIEAMRLLANGGADPALFDYSGDPDSDADDDSYDSVFGGEDQRWKPAHCYVKDIESGIDYEIAGNAGSNDSGSLIEDGIDINSLTFDPDEAEVRNWTTTSCLQISSLTVPSGGSPGYVFLNHTMDAIWEEYVVENPVNGSIYMVWQDSGLWRARSWEWIRRNMTWRDLSNLDDEGILPSYGSEIGIMVTTLSRGPLFPAIYSNGEERSNIAWLRYENGASSLPCPEYELKCSHLFPKKYYLDSNRNNEVRIKNEDEDLLVGDPESGHGRRFTLEEERFWGTDPNSKDTNNDGVPDEEALTGKGMMRFKWTYQEGDQIGVALEGVSDNTDYRDSSLKTMWGLLENDFSGRGGCRISPGTIPVVTEGGEESMREVTLGTNLNDCLEENFVDPSQGTLDKLIGVDLSYSPQNPMNDPNGQDGGAENSPDELHIMAGLSNVEDESFVRYNWEFFNCPDASGSDCSPIDSSLLRRLGAIKTAGLGIKSIRLRLAIPGADYLKVRLRVIETTQEASGKSGQGQIVIPLQETSDRLDAYFVTATPLGDEIAASLDLSDGRDAYCDRKTCRVVKNEIVGLQLSRAPRSGELFSWSLDGKTLTTSQNSPHRIYFPILKDVGSKYSVKLDMTSENADGLGSDKKTLARDFEVVHPTVSIESTCTDSDTECSLPRKVEIGYVIDPKYPDIVKQIDYDENLLLADMGSTISLTPIFNFDSSIFERTDDQGNLSWRFVWFVDGIAVDPANSDRNIPWIDPADGNLHLPITKGVGEKYDVAVKALYTQSGEMKKALTGTWNVAKEYFYEENIDDSLEIEVVENAPAQGRLGTEKIVASLFAGMPEYLNFLLRIVLTLALIIFTANLSLTFFPQKRHV